LMVDCEFIGDGQSMRGTADRLFPTRSQWASQERSVRAPATGVAELLSREFQISGARSLRGLRRSAPVSARSASRIATKRFDSICQRELLGRHAGRETRQP
jgi:hypothetical protein